jgi:hypothetical protein
MPAAACPFRPAIRIMKNSSSIVETIAQNFTRSSRGSAGSRPRPIKRAT